MVKITVTKNISGKRIDKFLIDFLGNPSKNFIFRLLRTKKVKVNKKRIDFKYTLATGDEVIVFLPDQFIASMRTKAVLLTYSEFFLCILYEDAHIILVQKPANMVVHEDKNEKRWVLQNFIIYYLQAKQEYISDSSHYMPSPVHRIDRNTEGIVIFAKTFGAFKAISNLFKNHTIIKHYCAIINGKLIKKIAIALNLFKDENSNTVSVDNIAGKNAITELYPIASNKDLSIVKASIVTGRTHQIRISCASIGHPIAGDIKYGYKKNDTLYKTGISSQMLIAYSITFPNDMGNEFSYLRNKTWHVVLSDQWKHIIYEQFSIDDIHRFMI